MQELESLGWNARLETLFETHRGFGREPARVASEHPGLFRLLTATGERLAVIGGKLHHSAQGRGDLPAVGDWVAISSRGSTEGRAVIESVLPRTSKFARQAAGGATSEQIVAANVDTVMIVAAANRDFNLRRLERYVGLAWASGAQPVIVVSKSDLTEDAATVATFAASVAPGVPVHVLSVHRGEGIEQLAVYLQAGRTVALLGSSGAGKSTLFNTLLGEERQWVQAIRAGDDRGRHTTTSRELVKLPCGALAIDTPGMRELGMWDLGDGLGKTFEDIEALRSHCFYRDCRHGNEPHCAVREALESGVLDAVRLRSFENLQREMAHQARREDHRLALAEKQRWKKIHQDQKQRPFR